MDEALPVGKRHRLRDGDHQLSGSLGRSGSDLKYAPQILPLDVLLHDEDPITVAANIVHGDDSRMFKLSCRTGFLDERLEFPPTRNGPCKASSERRDDSDPGREPDTLRQSLPCRAASELRSGQYWQGRAIRSELAPVPNRACRTGFVPQKNPCPHQRSSDSLAVAVVQTPRPLRHSFRGTADGILGSTNSPAARRISASCATSSARPRISPRRRRGSGTPRCGGFRLARHCCSNSKHRESISQATESGDLVS